MQNLISLHHMFNFNKNCKLLLNTWKTHANNLQGGEQFYYSKNLVIKCH